MEFSSNDLAQKILLQKAKQQIYDTEFVQLKLKVLMINQESIKIYEKYKMMKGPDRHINKMQK